MLYKVILVCLFLISTQVNAGNYNYTKDAKFMRELVSEVLSNLPGEKRNFEIKNSRARSEVKMYLEFSGTLINKNPTRIEGSLNIYEDGRALNVMVNHGGDKTELNQFALDDISYSVVVRYGKEMPRFKSGRQQLEEEINLLSSLDYKPSDDYISAYRTTAKIFEVAYKGSTEIKQLLLLIDGLKKLPEKPEYKGKVFTIEGLRHKNE